MNILIRAQNLTTREFKAVRDEMAATGAEASTFGQRFSAAALGISGFMTRIGLIGGALGAFSLAAAAHFQDAGNQVQAFSNISGAQLEKTKAQAIDLSNTFGVSATKIVQASRDIYNTGVNSVYPAMQVMAAGTKLAASQHAELDKVMMALDTTLKDYPNGFKNAADAAGQFATQARISRGTIDEISRAMAITEPLASKLGFSFSDLASVVDQLVRHGNSLQESNQMVSNTITKLVQPTNMMKAAAESLGLRWQDLYNVHGRKLSEVLKGIEIASHRNVGSEEQVAEAVGRHGIRSERLYEALKNHQSVLATLTGTTLGYKTILQSVTDQNYPEVIRNQILIANGAHNLDEAWKTASASAVTQFGIMKENVVNLGIAIGTDLLGPAVAVTHALSGLATVLTQFASAHRTITTLLVGGSAGFLALGLAMRGALAVAGLFNQSWILLRKTLEITGLLDAEEAAIKTLTATQTRAATAANLQAAAQKRLELQQAMSKAATEGNVAEQSRLAIVEERVRVQSEAASVAQARQAVAQGALAKSQAAQRASLEGISASQARLATATRATTAQEGLQTRAEMELAMARARTMSASNAMLFTNNELRSSQAAFQAALARSNITEQAAIDMARLHTVEGQRLTMAENEQTIAVDRSRAAWAELRVQESLARDAAAATALAQQAETAAVTELTLAEGRLATTSAEVVAGQQAVAATDVELGVANTGLAASFTAAALAEGAMAQATGILTGALDFLAANPLMAVLLVIGLLVVSIKLAYDHFEGFRNLVNMVGSGLSSFAEAVGSKVEAVFRGLAMAVDALTSKFEAVWNQLGPFQDVLLYIVSGPLFPIIEAFRHWSEICDILSVSLKKVTDAAGVFGSWLDKHDPQIKMLKNNVSDVASAMAHLGSQMDSTNAAHARETEAVNKTTSAYDKMLAKLGLPLNASVAQVKKAAADYRASWKSVEDGVQTMAASVTQDLSVLDTHEVFIARHIADTWIAQMARARMAVIGQLKALQAAVAVPIKMAPIAPPNLSQIQVKFNAAPGADTRGSAAGMAGADKGMAALTAALGKLPPEFSAAADRITSDFKTKIEAAHNDFLAKMTAENRRHADALGNLGKQERDQLKAEYQRAEQARKSEDSSYLSRLKQIQDDHAQRVSQYLQSQAITVQTSAANFQAAMASFDNRLQQLNQVQHDARQHLDREFLDKLKTLHGAHEAAQRATLQQHYNRQVNLLNDQIKRERDNINWHIQHLAAAFQEHNSGEIARMQAWLSGEKTTFDHHVSSLNAAHTHHVAGINAAHQRHVTGITTAHTNHVNKEGQVHTRHVDALTAAFNGHVAKITAAMKVISAPAGLWDKLKQSADNLAEGAMKALALKIAEHQRVTIADIQAVVSAQRGQDALTKAMKEAEAKVAALGGHALTASQKFQTLADSIGKNYKAAMDQATRDMFNFGHILPQHQAAIQRAINQQNKLTAAQAAAQAYLEANGAKHKKTADEWVQALSAAKTAIDTKLNSAIAQFVLAATQGGVNLGKAEADIVKYGLQQAAMAAREQQAHDLVTAAVLKMRASVVQAATAFDNVKNAADQRLKIALSAAALEYQKTGQISAATRMSLISLNAQVQANDRAMQEANNVLATLDNSFDGLSTRLKAAADTALQDFVEATYRASQGDVAAANSLAGLQQKAIDAANAAAGLTDAENKAKRAIDEATLASHTDVNSMVQHAQMVYEDAMALYEEAILHHATAETLAQLRSAADAAKVALYDLQQTIKDAEDQVSQDTGTGDTTGGTTDYQQFEEGMQDQKLALADQKQQFTEGLDTQKLQLAQQKAADAATLAANRATATSQKTIEAELRAQTIALQAALEVERQQLALANQALYLSRLGLSRIMVGNTQSFLNNLAGSAKANVSA